MGIKSRGTLIFLLLSTSVLTVLADNSYMKNAKISTRIVQTRYGRLQGLIVPMDSHRYLKPIEVFLGVPYATPPVKSNRFSPTRTPSPWDGVRVSDKQGPVCPQKLPDITNETAALEKMPKGRLDYLKRLLPYLKNQSEDCLYLNIYAPAQVDCVPIAVVFDSSTLDRFSLSLLHCLQTTNSQSFRLTYALHEISTLCRTVEIANTFDVGSIFPNTFQHKC
ncbi:unnamed protein product [Brassicogethes aeneus]|uniref:Carboxylesterase type B domain-containing protein n=1 Tax=Brassicogethes aeneus TaxID=1431903 RepID=A0A9P0FK78_BRAAE|nr:unnamed protein product [Brassicogethes aeneus]